MANQNSLPLFESAKWTPAEAKTYPERLFQWVSESELPPVDLFVTTADPELEPPIITVNTVLSLLALDYPANKLACYVSDDGCSPLTFYALVEASKFAKLWVPFCKKYNVQVRAPFRRFSDKDTVNSEHSSPEFKQEWSKMKDEYEQLSRKIDDATRKSVPSELEEEFAIFSNTKRTDHPTIIKVVWENKENDSDGLPHLIYISREKRPKHPHHYKSGAMNALTRVSGLMTNAPFILNVDCDMFVNNPKIVLHGLCILLDCKGRKEVAFIQCPQKFYDGLKDYPFGNQMVVFFTNVSGGMAGIQGPLYGGTNCFHRRKVIYGLSPDGMKHGKLSDKELVQKFGSSMEFVESASQALEEKIYYPNSNAFKYLEAVSQVAGCGYESGTTWGGLDIWLNGRGCAHRANIPYKRLEIRTCYTRSNSLYGLCTSRFANFNDPTKEMGRRDASNLNLQTFPNSWHPLRKAQIQAMPCVYVDLARGLRPVPEICYAFLPAYCIITNSNFLPKDIGLWIAATLLPHMHSDRVPYNWAVNQNMVEQPKND
ncbi:hypothetical protein L6164_018862 [Bauhinia variegata]|uniref:Uncharacterized protein n=1 Tax=Bauhinia variegata TaxID=167791 RepID=A0ACB9NCN1_BAUVA|nr:hypothetical protein L6164_018862 [Bauhinia variegata]